MDFAMGLGREPFWFHQGRPLPSFEDVVGCTPSSAGGVDPSSEWAGYVDPSPPFAANLFPENLTAEQLAHFSMNGSADTGSDVRLLGDARQSSDGSFTRRSSREGDLDAGPGSDRLEKAKERNRQAVRKFRERQKMKAQAKEAVLEHLMVRLEHLMKEKEELQRLNQALQSRFALLNSNHHCLTDEPAPVSDEVGSGPRELQVPDFVPYQQGWRDFRPAAALVLLCQGRPLRLTPTALRNMDVSHIGPIWNTYVNEMASQLPHVQGPESTAYKRLEGMKNELNGLCALFFMHNPVMLHKMQNICIVDPTGAHHVPSRTDSEWLAIAELLNLTGRQQAMLRKARDLHNDALDALQNNHADAERPFQDVGQNSTGFRAGPSFLNLLSASQSLNSKMEEAHHIFCVFGTQTWASVLDPIQFATFMVTTFPWMADMWRLIQWADIAASHSQGSGQVEEDGPQVESLMTNNFHRMHQWQVQIASSGLCARLSSAPSAWQLPKVDSHSMRCVTHIPPLG